MIKFFYPGPNKGGYHLVKSQRGWLHSSCHMILDVAKYTPVDREPQAPIEVCPACSRNAAKFAPGFKFRKSTKKAKKENAGGDEVYQTDFQLSDKKD